MARPSLPTGIVPASIRSVMQWLHGQWAGDADKIGFTDGSGDLVLKDAAGARTTLDVYAKADVNTKAEANAAFEAARVIPDTFSNSDAEAALNDALTAAGAGVGRRLVVVDAQDAQFGSQLVIPDNVTLMLREAASLKLMTAITGSGVGALKIEVGADRAGVVGGTLDINSKANVGIQSTGGASRLTIVTAIRGVSSYAVDLQDSVDVAKVTLDVDECVHGVRVRGDCKYVHVDDGVYRGIRSYGIEFRATATDATVGCRAKGNVLRDFDPAIPDPGESRYAKQAIVAYGAPGALTAGDSAYHTDLSYLHNWSYGLGTPFQEPDNGNGDMFLMHYVDGFAVVGNHALDGGENGMSIVRFNSNGVVTKNRATRNQAVGIQVGRADNPSRDIDVEGNIVYDNARKGDTQSNMLVQDVARVRIRGNASFVDDEDFYDKVDGPTELPRGYTITGSSDATFEDNFEDGAVVPVSVGTTTWRLYRFKGDTREHLDGVHRFRYGLSGTSKWRVEARDEAGVNPREPIVLTADATNYGEVTLRGTARKFDLSMADQPTDHLNFDTLTVAASNAPGTVRRDSTGAQDNYIVFELPFGLQAGTYSLALWHGKLASGGIVHIDGSEDGATWVDDLATVDTYAASTSNGERTEVTGVTMPTSVRFIRLRMASKNASSSNYTGRLCALFGVRTGA